MKKKDKLCLCGCGEFCTNKYKIGHNIKFRTKEEYDEISKKISKTLMNHTVSEETKKKIGLGNRRKIVSDLTKQKLSLINKGKSYIEMYGEDKAKNKIENFILTRREKDNFKHSELTKEQIKNYFLGKTSIMLYGENRAKNIREKRSNSMKEKWKDKEYAKLVVENSIKGLIKRPTSYEKKISVLCIENNLPFIYCGDGTFLVGHKNPDFVDKKNKVVIEVYYSYYKIRDFGSCENYEKLRSNYFNKYGYTTIFIRDNEITDNNWKDKCLNKINGIINYV